MDNYFFSFLTEYVKFDISPKSKKPHFQSPHLKCQKLFPIKHLKILNTDIVSTKNKKNTLIPKQNLKSQR